MRHFRIILLAALAALILPATGRACDRPVCLAGEALKLPHLITFDDVPSSFALGSRIDTVLVRPGARFGDHFAGQIRAMQGNHDLISGPALSPLTVRDGGVGRTLGVMRLLGTNILLGHGPLGYPKTEAVGEGAIATLFDRDQSVLGFDLRGGENGQASITFLRRNGSVIDTLILGPVGEQVYTFVRQGKVPDIAGFVLLNTDPQGVAIDNVRFGGVEIVG